MNCQRWRERRDRYRPAGEVIDPARYSVQVIDRTTAAAFVRAHHYSGSYVASRLQVGLFSKPSPFAVARLAGVCAFSVPMNQRTVPRWLGVAPAAGLELGRLVLLDEVPGNGESWFTARALAHLHEQIPGVQSVVSFSDPLPRRRHGHLIKPGHVGIVYQALGARYAGRSCARWLLLDAEGRVVSGRSLSKLRNGERGAGGMERHLRDLGAPRRRAGESGRDYAERAVKAGLLDGWLSRVKHEGNHAYLFPVLPTARRARARSRRQTEARWPDSRPYPRDPDAGVETFTPARAA